MSLGCGGGFWLEGYRDTLFSAAEALSGCSVDSPECSGSGLSGVQDPRALEALPK